MQFTEIQWQSELYDQEIELRLELLRVPLGLTFSAEELQLESAELHFGMLDGGRLIACAVIVPLSIALAKLRQMAVATAYQRKGIGASLIGNIELALQDRQFEKIELHARDNACGFYEQLGYRKQGPQFIEVSLPHWKMTKSIRRRHADRPG
jgi:predicted GNAT family N-acyltransferase